MLLYIGSIKFSGSQTHLSSWREDIDAVPLNTTATSMLPSTIKGDFPEDLFYITFRGIGSLCKLRGRKGDFLKDPLSYKFGV